MSDQKKVYGAIASVTEKLSKEGISKARKNTQQGYNFRGIDDVYNALAPFLAEAKLCILPSVISRDVVERETKNGGALFYVTVKVDFAFVSAEDGSEHHVVTYGEAMDSGDKATNKAMSAAYKYAAMQAFCIPTEGDNDADSHTHEVKAKTPNSAEADRILAAGVHPAGGVWEAMEPDMQIFLADLAAECKAMLKDGDIQAALNLIAHHKLDADQKVALNTRFDSKERSAMKKFIEAQKTKEPA